MEVWDDEPDNDADLINRFIIAILGTVLAVNESEPTIIEGVNGIGNLTIAYYNFTTIAITSSSSKISIRSTCGCCTCVAYTFCVHLLYLISVYSGNEKLYYI